jgi:hypothetical protein
MKDNEDVNPHLKSLIENNVYISNCVTNKKRNIHSISYLSDVLLSQSDCIKLGVSIESVLRDIIMSLTKNIQDIKIKNIKGVKEKDHLFIDDIKKIIYYAELKCNINLDTEKSKAVSAKCISIVEELKEQYPSYFIHMKYVSCRHLNTIDIPKKLLNKFSPIKEHIVGVNDYLKFLNVEYQFETIKSYKVFVNYVIEMMLKIKN